MIFPPSFKFTVVLPAQPLLQYPFASHEMYQVRLTKSDECF